MYALVPEGWRVECLSCRAVWTEPHLAMQRRSKPHPDPA